jgi:hypothetical protein
MYGVIALLPVIVIAAIFLWNVLYMFDYKNFKVEFAASVAYAQENDCLRAEYGGEVMRITSHNANSIYTAVTGGGFAGYEKEAPSQDGLFLDFGDGASMQVWSAGDTGLIVHYTNADTDIFYRTSDDTRYINLERIVSAEWGNTPWADAG